MVDLVWDGMTDLRERLQRYAPTAHPILLLGETGTGKSQIAAWIHQQSGRSTGPYEELNCAGLSEHLFETELFGSKKGAFTGALDRNGAFLRVDGGTLFLDELGEIPLALQAKLLKAVETGEIRRLGDSVLRKVAVRLICATNQPLLERVRNGTFREDLYHRIAVLPVTVLPVRERKGCIRPIFQQLYRQAVDARAGAHCQQISRELWRVLEGRPWMGNIREMRNFAVRLSFEVADSGELQSTDLDRVDFEKTRSQETPAPGADSSADFDNDAQSVVFELRAHVNAVCAAAGITEPESKQLVERMAEQLGTDLVRYRHDSAECVAARKALFRDLTITEGWPLHRVTTAALAVVLRWDCGRRGVVMSTSLFTTECSKSFSKAPNYTAVIKPIIAWLDLRQAQRNSVQRNARIPRRRDEIR